MGLIEIGTAAPEFSLPDATGVTHTLSDYRGHPVVVYFYPKDDTPGCTIESCAFRDNLPAFQDQQAVVLGVSPDNEASHAKFAAKFDLPFTLLADTRVKTNDDDKGTPAMCDAYGVWQERTRYGKTSMGVARTTYLIDAAGIVVQRWDAVKVEGHAEAVLEAVRGL